MRRGNRASVVFAALALVFAVLLVAGCGGNGDGSGQLTVEEFFRALDVLDDEYAATTDELEANTSQAMEEVTSAEERIEVFVSFTQDGAVALENFIDGIAELNPPDELQELQDRTVSAGRAATDALNDLVSRLGDVSTEEEFETVLAEVTPEPFDRLNAVCFEAQALADDAGVDVDFDCDE